MQQLTRHGQKAAVTRRELLQLGAAAVSTALAPRASGAPAAATDRKLILLFLTGGPSQIDTWDPKPAAPSDVRGPFRPIATAVPGLHISELFPRLAPLARHFTIVRSVYHDSARVHEVGQQLLQTGRLARPGDEFPHLGALLSQRFGPARAGLPAFVILPGPLGDTGINISHGQGAGYLGPRHAAWIPPGRDNAPWPDELRKALDLSREPASDRARYGAHEFGRTCLQARRLVEAGVRCVTVNMFATVFDTVTWDCHAEGGSLPTTLDDYRKTVGPMFDQACAALIDDLVQRGLLASTLVAAVGEFGRSPRLNPRGGRDHWPAVWSVLLAGGGLEGGQVI
ncbi:MAG: DUF1501 domain-containing protein, partial [Gemmataceae bacterium]|nr:DUF1501 domain-containing protein [Gemmataceae bacterium]